MLTKIASVLAALALFTSATASAAPGPELGFQAAPAPTAVGASAAGEMRAAAAPHRKTTLVAINPFGVAVGWPSLSISHAVSPRIAVRGDVARWQVEPFNLFGDEHSDQTVEQNTEVGIGAPTYVLGSMFNGLFIEPGFIYRRSTRHDVTEVATGPQVLVGGQGTFGFGLSIALAVGAGRDLVVDQATLGSDDKRTFLNGYLRVGYAF